MRIYKITATNVPVLAYYARLEAAPLDEEATATAYAYAGSMADAKAKAAELRSTFELRKQDVAIDQIELATGKQGILAALNAAAAGVPVEDSAE